MLEIDDRIKQNPAYGNVLYDNGEDFFKKADGEFLLRPFHLFLNRDVTPCQQNDAKYAAPAARQNPIYKIRIAAPQIT